jgi:ABC-type antimicrobial peptide transport system permease subunit
MLAGAALMVLLACSSVAGLQLFRAARQDRAIAVQLALGASPGRLIRRSLIESALLATAGSLGAVAVAWVVARVLVFAAPLDVPRLATARVGTPAVLIVTGGLAALACVLGALALGRFVAGLLVETPPHDPVSIAGAAILTLVAGLAGCLLPANRAAASNPTDLLRD